MAPPKRPRGGLVPAAAAPTHKAETGKGIDDELVAGPSSNIATVANEEKVDKVIYERIEGDPLDSGPLDLSSRSSGAAESPTIGGGTSDAGMDNMDTEDVADVIGVNLPCPSSSGGPRGDPPLLIGELKFLPRPLPPRNWR